MPHSRLDNFDGSVDNYNFREHHYGIRLLRRRYKYWRVGLQFALPKVQDQNLHDNGYIPLSKL